MITYLPLISDLLSYTGTDDVVFVNDPDQGGYFNHYPASPSQMIDHGTVFPADPHIHGYWVRQYSPSSGIFFTWYGAIKNNPSIDNIGAFRLFLTACDNLSKKGYIPDGSYYFQSTLNLVSDIVLEWSENAVFIPVPPMPPPTPPPVLNALFAQATFPLTNVTLINLHIDYSTMGYSGVGVALYCNNLTLFNPKIFNFIGGNALQLAGNNVLITKAFLQCNSSALAGSGGIRFCGGSNFMCRDSYVESGDDAFQFAPIAVPTIGTPPVDNNFFNRAITDSTYLNCKGFSYGARLGICYLDENQNCINQRNTFDNVTGHGSSAQYDIYVIDLSATSYPVSNLYSTAFITHDDEVYFTTSITNRGYPPFNVLETVVISNAGNSVFNGPFQIFSSEVSVPPATCKFTCRVAGFGTYPVTIGGDVVRTDTNRLSDITLNNLNINGTVMGSTHAQSVNLQNVKDIHINNLTVINPKATAMLITNCKRVKLNNTKLDASLKTGSSLLQIDNSTDIYWTNGALIGNRTATNTGDTMVLVGSLSTLLSSNVRFKNTLFYNTPDSPVSPAPANYGLDFLNANDSSAVNCSFQNLRSPASGTAIDISASSARCEIIANDLSNTGSSPIANLSSSTFLFGNGSKASNLLLSGTVTGAPLVIAAGTNLTAPINGAMEFDGTHFYTTSGGTRYQLDQNKNRIVSPISTSQTGAAAAGTTYVYLVSGTTTFTLPTAAGNKSLYIVKNTGSGTDLVTIMSTSPQTIFYTAAVTSLSPAVGNCYYIVSNNTNWVVIYKT